MGVLDRFEKGVERAVNGAFARAFRSEVQPVEVASALRRETDTRAAVVGRGRTLVPNMFVVELGQSDHERLGEWEEALSDELIAVVVEHANTQGYAFVGPVTVGFEEAEDLDTGVFRIRSSTVKGRTSPRPAAATPPPPPAPVRPATATGNPRPGSSSPAPTVSTGSLTVSLEIDGVTHPVTGPVTVIGRSGDVDIAVEDAGVSRQHAEVHVMGGQVRVVDLGSTNGTFVDGDRVTTENLRDGSRITIGRSTIVVHVDQR